jgi:hypothetical protein
MFVELGQPDNANVPIGDYSHIPITGMVALWPTV